MSEVTGFFYPRTATGRASLLPPPPWHYSGDLLTVEYRTDPARVAELLPAPLEPAQDDPGAVALIWADWQSCGDSQEELLDPVTLREESASGGFVNAHPMAHHRWMPSIEKGAPDAFGELIRSGSASFEGGPAWRGDATLDLFDFPTEELARLTVDEVIAGYYRQVAISWDGGRVLAGTQDG